MKRVMMTVLIVVSMFVCLPSVWADVYAPAVGDNIVINYAPNYPSNWNGGPFTLTDQTTIQSYVTYCLTDTEYFTPGAQYKVTGYETDISTNVALFRPRGPCQHAPCCGKDRVDYSRRAPGQLQPSWQPP